MYMGNGSSTSQKVEQIIQNYTEANAVSLATSECTQKVTVDAPGAFITGCNGGFVVKQNCSAVSNASLDTVVKALQSATIDAETEQAATGLALAANVSVTDTDMVSKTVNKLVANCKSNANAVADQVHHYNFAGMIMDCTSDPDANIINITQYNNADAACVVKQIVDAGQTNVATSKTKQTNTGIGLPACGACLGVIALVIFAPALMPGKKNKENNMLKNLLGK